MISEDWKERAEEVRELDEAASERMRYGEWVVDSSMLEEFFTEIIFSAVECHHYRESTSRNWQQMSSLLASRGSACCLFFLRVFFFTLTLVIYDDEKCACNRRVFYCCGGGRIYVKKCGETGYGGWRKLAFD